MNLSMRLAGIFASIVFMITAIPGLYQQIMPNNVMLPPELFSGITMLEILVMSIAGSALAGFIGYWIGDILSHPQGVRLRKRKERAQALKAKKLASETEAALPPPEAPEQVHGLENYSSSATPANQYPESPSQGTPVS